MEEGVEKKYARRIMREIKKMKQMEKKIIKMNRLKEII